MSLKYVVNNFHAISEKDKYLKGCYGETLHEWGKIDIKASTITKLLQKLQEEFNCTRDDILLNSCDELGRIDVQVLQLKAFNRHKISEKNYNKFKNGEIDLWFTTYTVYVEMTVSEIDLEEILQDENNSLQNR